LKKHVYRIDRGSSGFEEFEEGDGKGEEMKRFFKAVERDGSFKKQTLSQVGGGGGGYVVDGEVEKREPNKFMAWNVNSFLLRLKSDRDEVLSLFHHLDLDVIAIHVKKTTISLYFSKKICSPSALWLGKAPPTTTGIHCFSAHTMLQELKRSWCFRKYHLKSTQVHLKSTEMHLG
jgi:hypothetical protein